MWLFSTQIHSYLLTWSSPCFKQNLNQLIAVPESSTQFSSQWSNKLTMSNAALRSSDIKTDKKTNSSKFSSVLEQMSLNTLMRAVSVLWWGRKPDWKTSKQLLSAKKLFSCWNTAFLMICPKKEGLIWAYNCLFQTCPDCSFLVVAWWLQFSGPVGRRLR